MRALKIISYILIIIGALNWALVGIFNFDLVALLFGEMSLVSRIIYIVIGLAAIVSIATTFREILKDKFPPDLKTQTERLAIDLENSGIVRSP